MTTPATAASPSSAPTVVQRITAQLNEMLEPTRLEVVNESHHHAGHMGDDGTGETHFAVTVESPRFVGLNRVGRQRLVNQALAELLAGPIHALSIRATAPGE
jgi:BolA protein